MACYSRAGVYVYREDTSSSTVRLYGCERRERGCKTAQVVCRDKSDIWLVCDVAREGEGHSSTTRSVQRSAPATAAGGLPHGLAGKADMADDQLQPTGLGVCTRTGGWV